MVCDASMYLTRRLFDRCVGITIEFRPKRRIKDYFPALVPPTSLLHFLLCRDNVVPPSALYSHPHTRFCRLCFTQLGDHPHDHAYYQGCVPFLALLFGL